MRLESSVPENALVERHIIQFADGSFLYQYNAEARLQTVGNISHAKLIRPEHSDYLAALLHGRVLVVLCTPDFKQVRLCARHVAGEPRLPLSFQATIDRIDEIKRTETVEVLQTTIGKHREALQALAKLDKKDKQPYVYKRLDVETAL